MTTHYRQLTQGQRYQIEAGLSAAESQASIAKRVGVHPSTISREVRRNSTQNIYKAVSAAHESDARRAGAGFYPVSTDGLKRAENFRSCLATLRRIRGL